MTDAEREALTARIEEIVRAQDTGIGVTAVEIEFRPNRDGELSVYVTVGMPAGTVPKRAATFMTETTDVLAPEMRTSEGYLFPYVYSDIEEDEAA